MLTEDFCSFEVAKLLKEKGFNEPIWTRYEDDNEVIFGDKYNWNNSPMGQTSAPTHQMAMKWLREKGLCVVVYPYNSYYEERYEFEIYKRIDENSYEWKSFTEIKNTLFEGYNTCVETALKYALENLL